MQEINNIEMLVPEIDMQPRVYVRKLGGKYIEIMGIQSFEKRDSENAGGEMIFVMAAGQDEALKNTFLNSNDQYIDVKMELSIGMLVKFSGHIEDISSNAICFAVSTPITTDVLDSSDAE